MKFSDLFAGIGGFHIAMKNVLSDAECVFSSDHDKAVAKTYEINFGLNPLNDITQQDISKIPEHDFVMAGFPCQPFSKNGKYYNKNKRTVSIYEDRDQLYMYLVKLLTVKKPKMFLFENVKGLTKMKTPDGFLYYDLICEQFVNAGYTLYSTVLNSADYGVPQQRKRVYFVGFRNDIKHNFRFPDPIPQTRSVIDVLEIQVDGKYMLNNLWRNRRNVRLPGMRLEALRTAYDSGTWKSPNRKVNKIVPLAIVKGDTPSGAPRQQDKLYSKYGISPTIATFSTPSFDTFNGWRTLTPRECARLQGFPDSFKLPTSDSEAYKQVGNAISIPVVEQIIRNMMEAVE